jgi:hypothetical protein
VGGQAGASETGNQLGEPEAATQSGVGVPETWCTTMQAAQLADRVLAP